MPMPMSSRRTVREHRHADGQIKDAQLRELASSPKTHGKVTSKRALRQAQGRCSEPCGTCSKDRADA
jgi:hypothetical protein